MLSGNFKKVRKYTGATIDKYLRVMLWCEETKEGGCVGEKGDAGLPGLLVRSGGSARRESEEGRRPPPKKSNLSPRREGAGVNLMSWRCSSKELELLSTRGTNLTWR